MTEEIKYTQEQNDLWDEYQTAKFKASREISEIYASRENLYRKLFKARTFLRKIIEFIDPRSIQYEIDRIYIDLKNTDVRFETYYMPLREEETRILEKCRKAGVFRSGFL